MATFTDVLKLPIFKTRGTAAPGVTPGGIGAITSRKPAIKFGTAPAYGRAAFFPPTVTETGKTGLGSTVLAILPSIPGGFVCPSPVAYTSRTEFCAAGSAGELKR